MHQPTILTLSKRLLFGVLLILSLTSSARALEFPLKVHATGRYLVDQTGTPVFLNGDAAWSLIVQPDYDGASQYLTDRAGRGFNAVLVNLVEHHYADNAPANISGAAPFTGAPFASPNEAYFAHADSVIDWANQLGIVVLLAPIYLGYQCGDEGWCGEVQAASVSDIMNWGQYLGDRYKQYPNIIWVIGGDTDPSPVREKIDSMVIALQAADAIYPDRIITAHGPPGEQALTVFPESWLMLNNTYTWNLTEVIALADQAYSHSPTLPFIFMEGRYENSVGIDDQQLRAQAYWSVLRGAVGNVFGNNPVWYFGSDVVSGSNEDWGASLGSSGALAMSHLWALVTSRHWYKLIPDVSGSVLTGGAMTGTNQAVLAYTSDSTSIIGYLPTRRTVTINPSVLKGSQLHVQWYNPSSGNYTDAGIVPNAAGNYTPPFESDWVLVLDAIVEVPSPPTLNTPMDGSIGTSVNPLLGWTTSSGAISYRIQVASDPGFVTTVIDRSEVIATAFTPSGLSYNSTYYWRVNASNIGGSSPFSSIWSFSTVAPDGCCAGIRGNINNDPLDEINITDLTYLVSYMFKSGPAPPCELEGDVNGSGGPLDIADLVVLKNYMFKGESAPAACPMVDFPGTSVLSITNWFALHSKSRR